MDDNPNKWCPLIKDFCKGQVCVCYSETVLGAEDLAYCTTLKNFVPKDKP